MNTIYTRNGYKNRAHYLDSLAEHMGIDEETVHSIADIYGPSEDFDGLVTALEDFAI